MLVPALLYLLLNPGGQASAGWGIVIGTDTAFLLGMLALVGPAVSTQLRIFLLTLTVIDDIVAVSVIGVVYSDAIALGPLAVAGGCLVVLVVLGRVGVWRASPYVAVVVVLWVATLESGVHASIAGMVSGLLVPALNPERGLVESAATQFRAFRQSPLPTVQRRTRRQLNRAISVNERLQEVLHGWTSFVVVPVFALANAGVDLRGGLLGEALRSPVTWGVVVGLVVGKLVGIGVGAHAAARRGWGSLPQGVGPGHVWAGSALSGIGFTVSLLIAGLAFESGRLQDEAVVGVLLAAVLAGVVGWLLFRVAARRGEGDAALPTRLSDPVDPEIDHVKGVPTPSSRWSSTSTTSARSALARPARPTRYGRTSATGCATSPATSPSRCTRTRSGPQSRRRPPPGRAGSGRCTTTCSGTRTGSRRRTWSTTPPRSASTSTASSRTSVTRRCSTGSGATSPAPRPAVSAARPRSSSGTSGTPVRSTRAA